MSSSPLCHNPRWREADLGLPLPDSHHAVSVAMPRWQDVVGYEERRPEVMSRLQLGYPRFVIHPLVKELCQKLGATPPCLPFPSATSARLCARFIQQTTGEPVQTNSAQCVWIVQTSKAAEGALKAFWQHTGVIVPSRQAEAWLAGRQDLAEAEDIRGKLRQELASLYACQAGDVFLAPTGMAAHYAALRALLIRHPGCATVQLGFPYVDTFKLQQKLGHSAILLPHLDQMAEALRGILQRQSLTGCFCELPGNPLLGSADMRVVSPILREHRVPLVIDDVVATPVNVDLRPYADLVATSLTKFIAGTGDVMGGAVICNPTSPFHRELKTILQSIHEELLWGEDALVLASQIGSFPERMRQHNASGLWLAERLRQHPRVERVWYPRWEFAEAYEAVRRPAGGWGALITILPKQAETRSAKIFDALQFCKGPSLGTVFSLACPFTLLAHYSELEWAEACGVSRFLLRLSIGLEDRDELWRRLDTALLTD